MIEKPNNRIERVVDDSLRFVKNYIAGNGAIDRRGIFDCIKEAMPTNSEVIMYSTPNQFQSEDRAKEWMFGYVTIRVFSQVEIMGVNSMPEMEVYIDVTVNNIKINRMVPAEVDVYDLPRYSVTGGFSL